ncbi:MAG: GNAT family N-acetyltransferase, partial [Clostridia bacterium]|nr:GNAT family N-acetyltransferase [Clostridia bacterium]
PKLYREKYAPWESNYVAKDNGRYMCAVGAYDEEYSVAGETIRFRGIGNVAAHPRAKGKGYMRAAMDAAMADMIKDGVDFSALGGLRHRYGYWSFEVSGIRYRFHVNYDCIKHGVKHIEEKHALSFEPLKADDTDTVQWMNALREKLPFYCTRSTERTYDVLRSWKSTPYVVYENGERVGCFIQSGGTVHDIQLIDDSYLCDLIRRWYKVKGDYTVILPPYRTEWIDFLTRYSCGPEVISGESYTVFSYERVCRAFLRAKASYEKLADGSLILLIHGVAGDERLKFCVNNGIPTVTPTDEDADLELEHKEAMMLIFGVSSPMRTKLGAAERSWFPLPLHTDNADEV